MSNLFTRLAAQQLGQSPSVQPRDPRDLGGSVADRDRGDSAGPALIIEEAETEAGASRAAVSLSRTRLEPPTVSERSRPPAVAVDPLSGATAAGFRPRATASSPLPSEGGDSQAEPLPLASFAEPEVVAPVHLDLAPRPRPADRAGVQEGELPLGEGDSAQRGQEQSLRTAAGAEPEAAPGSVRKLPGARRDADTPAADPPAARAQGAPAPAQPRHQAPARRPAGEAAPLGLPLSERIEGVRPSPGPEAPSLTQQAAAEPRKDPGPEPQSAQERWLQPAAPRQGQPAPGVRPSQTPASPEHAERAPSVLRRSDDSTEMQPPQAATEMPITVRIGRIEVRGRPAAQPPRPAPPRPPMSLSDYLDRSPGGGR